MPDDFSAEYYARGRAQPTKDGEDVVRLLLNRTRDYIVCGSAGLKSLPVGVRNAFKEVARLPANHGFKMLLREKFTPGGTSWVEVWVDDPRGRSPADRATGGTA